MENTIYTLHDYMLHTESITYVIIVAALIGITFFIVFSPKEMTMRIDFGFSDVCGLNK